MIFNNEHNDLVNNNIFFKDNFSKYVYMYSYEKGDFLENGKVVKNNNVYVRVKHLNCSKEHDVQIYSFTKGKFPHNGNNYCCCRYEESIAHFIIEILKEPISKYWHESNELDPFNIKVKSGKLINIKCDTHTYYTLRCSDFANGIRCGYCKGIKTKNKDSFYEKNEKLASYIIDAYKDVEDVEYLNKYKDVNQLINELKSISENSHKKFYFKCPYCKNIDIKIIRNMVKKGYNCKCFSSNNSIGELFAKEILNQLGVKYYRGVTSKMFNWVGSREYDFYIPSLNTIIEIHGRQHYEEKGFISCGGRSLEEEIANDRYKRWLALNNGIKRYYSIDCRKSQYKWMKDNIKRVFEHIFSLEDIDWKLAWKNANKNKCVEVWDCYNSGNTCIKTLANMFGLSGVTIRDYISKGVECGYITLK